MSTPPAADPHLVPPDRSARTYGDGTRVPAWLWVDLPAVRRAFGEAGFTEHVSGNGMTALMTRGDVEVLVPLSDAGADWARRAGEALGLLERLTGTSTFRLGALTEREAALWRIVDDTVENLQAYACDDRHRDAAGRPYHPTWHDPDQTDLFALGRCEMQGRIAGRLYHLLHGADPGADPVVDEE